MWPICGESACSPLYRKYPEKYFLFYWYDTARPVLPGLYASLRPRARANRLSPCAGKSLCGYRPLTGRERYLAAFEASASLLGY